jgi:hypothetical protein
MPPTLFAVVIFEIGSYFLPRLAWTMTLLFMLPSQCTTTPSFFLLIWTRTMILLILASQETRIIGMNHWHPASSLSFWNSNYMYVVTINIAIQISEVFLLFFSLFSSYLCFGWDNFYLLIFTFTDSFLDHLKSAIEIILWAFYSVLVTASSRASICLGFYFLFFNMSCLWFHSLFAYSFLSYFHLVIWIYFCLTL